MNKKKIIFKSIFNFFAKNIFSIIGIIMLVFFSSATFTTLNNATNNLNSSYLKVVKSGNLHDFVINERFALGSSSYNVVPNSGKFEIVPNPNPEDGGPPNVSQYSFRVTPFDIKEGTLTNELSWTNSYFKIFNDFQEWKLNPLPSGNDFFSQNKNLFEETTYFLIMDKPLDPEFNLDNNTETQKIIQENLNNLEILTNEYMPFNYISDIQSQNNVSLRNYKSIDVPSGGTFYKIIENDPKYLIDKIVLFEGQNLSESNSDFNNLFTKYADLDGNKKDGAELGRKILKILSDTSWSVSGKDKNFEAYLNFINEDLTNNPWVPKTMPPLRSPARSGFNDFKTIIDKRYFREKGFSISFDVKNLIPFSGIVEDKTSYEIIVTPEYLERNNKKIFPYDVWLSNFNKSQNDFTDWFSTIPIEYKIKIDEIYYLIIGSGISPDFMYPIISNERIIPNLESEVISYTNNSGFLKVHDSFRNSYIESMILGKFNNGVENKQAIIDNINFLSKSLMDWPENMNAAFFANDTSNVITPSALRVIFIPNIMQIVTLVSYFLTSFIVFVSTIIITLFIKRFIELNKVNLAILQANGYKKRDIIFPMLVSILILVFIGSIIGFNLGLILQIPAIALFEGFWTLPIGLSSFNGITFLIFVLLLVGFYGLVAFFIIVFFLRGDNVNLMKDDSQYKGNFLINNSKKILKNTNPLNKFRISLAYHSLSKLLLLSVMTSLIMTSLVFASSTYESFENAISVSYGAKQYKYDLKLFTPTRNSGQYYGVPYDDVGMTLIDGKFVNESIITKEELNDPLLNKITLGDVSTDGAYSSYSNIRDINHLGKNPALDTLSLNGNWHLPSIQDINRQSTILFLKYMTQNKGLLDVSILGTNPWDIASRLMPVNQKNYSDNSFKDLFSKISGNNSTYSNIENIKSNIGNYREDITFSETLLKFSKKSDKNNPNAFLNNAKDSSLGEYIEIDKGKVINSRSIIEPEFLTLILNAFSNKDLAIKNYAINFNKIPLMTLNNKVIDETYTNVSFQVKKINNNDYKLSITPYDLKGINKETNYVLLKDQNNNNLINKLLQYEMNPDNVEIPIIINKFTANQFNLAVNDKIDIEVLNHIDRYKSTINPNFKLSIIGISNTFSFNEFFTLQEYANILTGMNFFKKNHESNDSIYEPFNAIMSADDSLVQVNNTLSSYSPSGIYIGGDRFSSTSFLEILSLPRNTYAYLEEAANVSGINLIDLDPNWELNKPSAAIKFKNELIRVYGDSTYVSMLDNIISLNSLRSLSNDIAISSTFIQTSILLIIIIISTIIITLIIFMLILDSLKIAGMIKILGLKNFSNAISFMSIYFVAVFLGIIISIPLSFFVNFLYLNLIFNTANILLIAPITVMDYVIASLSLTAFFIVTFSLNWIKIKKLNLTKTIK